MSEMTFAERMCNLIEDHESDLRLLIEADKSIEGTLLAALERLVVWDVETTSDLSEGDVIVAFSFGIGPDQTPGGTNQALASVIENVLRRHRVRVFAQWEIADALRAKGMAEDFRAVPQEGYLSTQGVWDQFRKEFDRLGMGIRKSILVAHPEHMFRCQWLIGMDNIGVLIPNEAFGPCGGWSEFGCDVYGYDPKSVQPWTTSRGEFVGHEIAARLNALRDRKSSFDTRTR